MTKALLLIDHGSKVEAANTMLLELVTSLRVVKPGTIIEAAHMELAQPTIAQGFDACVQKGATHVVAIPYMLSPGRHATTDIPRLVQQAAKQHLGIQVTVTDCLGLHPKLMDIILEKAAL